MSVVEMIFCIPFFVGALIFAVAGWEALWEARDGVRAERGYRKAAMRRAKEERDAMAR